MPARMLLLAAALLLPLPAAAQIFQQGPVPARAHQSPDMAAQAGHGIESENLFGPTLFWHVGESTWISATYAFQLAGREQGTPQTYDLGNFPRQMLKLKIGIEF